MPDRLSASESVGASAIATPSAATFESPPPGIGDLSVAVLVAYGRLPRRFVGEGQWQRPLILLAMELNSREPRERLHYVSGWFCSDPACEYRELAQPAG